MFRSPRKKFLLIISAVALFLGLAYAGITFLQALKAKKAAEEAVLIKQKEIQSYKTFDVPNTPEDFDVYTASDTTEVGYTVLKTLLGKGEEWVTGRTKQIAIIGLYNPDSGEFKLEAKSHLHSLNSGTEKRDKDIQPLFTNPEAFLSVDTILEPKLAPDTEFKYAFPATLKINETTIPVELEVEGKYTKTNVQVKGKTNIKMTDFGIKPPSLANVNVVSDEVEIWFDADLLKTQ